MSWEQGLFSRLSSLWLPRAQPYFVAGLEAAASLAVTSGAQHTRTDGSIFSCSAPNNALSEVGSPQPISNALIINRGASKIS